jgi:hypothetical protein
MTISRPEMIAVCRADRNERRDAFAAAAATPSRRAMSADVVTGRESSRKL